MRTYIELIIHEALQMRPREKNALLRITTKFGCPRTTVSDRKPYWTSKTKELTRLGRIAYSFDRVEKLSTKEIVALDIVLSPVGMTYYAGDTLCVVISSKDEIGSVMPGTPGRITNNKGVHILHTGGKYTSYLQMPLIK